MGTIKQGILGGFSGRVGTVVGSTWNSVHYMRALALSVGNPRTEKQQSQRSKFALTLSFLQAITPYVREGYRNYADRCTAFNAAMSYLLKNAVTGSGPDISIDYAKAMVARGSLTPVVGAEAASEGGKVTFTWTDNSGTGDAQPTDVAMPLVYNKDKRVAVYDMQAATREDGTAELTLPEGWDGDALAIYLAFRSADGRYQSNSLCLSDTPSTGGGGSEEEGGSPL